MLKSLSIRSKLVVLVVIPVIAALIVTLIGVYYVNKISSSMTKSVYEEGYQSISLILNADRDAYQATDAISTLLIKNGMGVLDQQAKDDAIAAYDENIGQTADRAKQTIDILSKNKEFWGKFTDEANGMTVFEHYDAFVESYSNWQKQAGVVKTTFSTNEEYLNSFNEARDHLNAIGELVGTGVQEAIAENNASKNTMIVTMAAIDVIVLIYYHSAFNRHDQSNHRTAEKISCYAAGYGKRAAQRKTQSEPA